jgi:hypothetical protein
MISEIILSGGEGQNRHVFKEKQKQLKISDTGSVFSSGEVRDALSVGIP